MRKKRLLERIQNTQDLQYAVNMLFVDPKDLEKDEDGRPIPPPHPAIAIELGQMRTTPSRPRITPDNPEGKRKPVVGKNADGTFSWTNPQYA